MDPRVDAYVAKASRWQQEIQFLRSLALACKLTEDVKWGKPCYTYEGRNVVLIQTFKAYCALLFFKGSLIDDPHDLLVPVGPNTKWARQIRIADEAASRTLRAAIRSTIQRAIEVEKSGLKPHIEPTEASPLVPELQRKLESDRDFKLAFERLTPGRQRGYHLYFAAAKQAQTRVARIERCIPKIRKGKGYNER